MDGSIFDTYQATVFGPSRSPSLAFAYLWRGLDEVSDKFIWSCSRPENPAGAQCTMHHCTADWTRPICIHYYSCRIELLPVLLQVCRGVTVMRGKTDFQLAMLLTPRMCAALLPTSFLYCSFFQWAVLILNSKFEHRPASVRLILRTITKIHPQRVHLITI